MANATIRKYLNGYPDAVGNKKRVVVLLNGPNPYAAGGVGIPKLVGVNNIHQIRVTLSNATYFCVPVLVTTNDYAKSTDIKLMFFVVATMLEAGAIDLSATIVRVELQGTN